MDRSRPLLWKPEGGCALTGSAPVVRRRQLQLHRGKAGVADSPGEVVARVVTEF